jgi:hypothetical protein
LYKLKTMKTLAFIFAAFLVSTTLYGQKLSEAQVPSTVLSAFKTSHPGVTHVKWEKEGSDYEGEF